MAKNHDYNTPQEGTSDWHIPLNQNFDQLDRDVEIRDADSNKGQYEPKDGALFRATDTGDVYLGDGSSWNVLNPPSGGSTDSTSSTTTVAPGNVQSAIDSLAVDNLGPTDSITVLKLQTNETYAPSSTWQVKPGVVLDCNGALIRTNEDVDIIHVHPNAGVWNPYIDQRGMTNWNSTMITLDTKYGRYWGVSHPLGLKNVRLISDAADNSHVTNQIGIHLHDSVSSPNGVTQVFCDGFIQGMNESIRLESSGGSSSWVNANRFHVDIWSFEQAITHRGVSGAAMNGNIFWCEFQPHKGTSQWAWSLGGESGYNTMYARCWERSRFTNGTVWEIQSPGHGHNTWIDNHGGFIDAGNVANHANTGTDTLVSWPEVGNTV